MQFDTACQNKQINMRIGILTFHRSINNGAVMQCYSLTKRLKKEFPDAKVEVIDYQMPLIDERVYDTSFTHYFKGSLKHKAFFLLNLSDNLKRIDQDRKRKASFQNALTNLPLSSEKIYSNGIEELVDYINSSYDVVVAGSDAIWNYSVRGFPNPYFLAETVKPKMFSYAASCYGMNYERIPSFQQKEIKQILDKYVFLGTRDEESELFLKSIGCSKAPVHTCDPTAFLDVDDLPIDREALIKKMSSRGFDFTKKTIGVMGGEKMCQMLRKMFGNQFQLVSLYNYNKLCDINLNDLTPYEWAYVFRFFSITITTYFHGTMLSLRNGIPVLSIALNTEYSLNHKTKVEDLLGRLSLNDCYWETDYSIHNIHEIKNKILDLIYSDLQNSILRKVDKEANTFIPFLTALSNQ